MKKTFALAALFAMAAGVAGAQTMKPGLWEINNKMQTNSGQMEQAMSQMQQQLASMPPEQRKMVQDMMAKQGVGVGGGGGAVSIKACITKEMIERNMVPTQQGDCKSSNSPRTGNSMKVSFTCTNPPSTGEGEITFGGPESYTMKMLVNTNVQGRPEKISMDASGKWMGADCGTIKPFASAAATKK